MRNRRFGFTIVELLVVIVVIGLLASITIVVYNGIQIRARNSSRLTQANQVTKLIDAYRAINGRYPKVAAGNYCVGTNFPNGKCREYKANDATAYLESDKSFVNELTTVGQVPDGKYYPAGSVVGPYVHVYASHFTLFMPMEIENVKDCPTDMVEAWNHPSSLEYLCSRDYNY